MALNIWTMSKSHYQLKRKRFFLCAWSTPHNLEIMILSNSFFLYDCQHQYLYMENFIPETVHWWELETEGTRLARSFVTGPGRACKNDVENLVFSSWCKSLLQMIHVLSSLASEKQNKHFKSLTLVYANTSLGGGINIK